jgi:cysteinyl-tRNA synthetase
MHKVTLWNSLGNELQEFKPIVPGKVSIYVCGPTVYSSPHIGNFRPAIVFDVLRRLFISLGYQVTYVSNYTDVDDKIIARAKELGIKEGELTEASHQRICDFDRSDRLLTARCEAAPTVYMPQIISYIEDLVKNGSAYVADGDVYFRISSIEGYGELSGNTPEQLLNGARIEVNSKKGIPDRFRLMEKDR